VRSLKIEKYFGFVHLPFKIVEEKQNSLERLGAVELRAFKELFQRWRRETDLCQFVLERGPSSGADSAAGADVSRCDDAAAAQPVLGDRDGPAHIGAEADADDHCELDGDTVGGGGERLFRVARRERNCER
jgi:hypothetical protein